MISNTTKGPMILQQNNHNKSHHLLEKTKHASSQPSTYLSLQYITGRASCITSLPVTHLCKVTSPANTNSLLTMGFCHSPFTFAYWNTNPCCLTACWGSGCNLLSSLEICPVKRSSNIPEAIWIWNQHKGLLAACTSGWCARGEGPRAGVLWRLIIHLGIRHHQQ